jgi:hypothetical protein
LALVLALTVAASGRAARADIAIPDTLHFLPVPADTGHAERGSAPESTGDGPEQWLRAPFGDNLLIEPERWRSLHGEGYRNDLLLDYNRVDGLRIGLNAQFQSTAPFVPRVGGRLEYAIGRSRTLYGLQLEQPLMRNGRLAAGVSAVRRTDHSELQQHEDLENTLALLFGRQDYRDYFERRGVGGYLLARIPSVSSVSIHVRDDEYRSLATDYGTRSWFHRDRTLRANPAVDEGTARTLVLRSERLARRAQRARPGLYHWMDFERAGHGLGGDFEYSRLLLDLRSVVRLTPASSMAMRMVGGHVLDGPLPFQKQYTIGGVDGLRGHRFAEFRGDHLALIQAEYIVGLWRLSSGVFQSGLHAIVFVDAGQAWFGPAGKWDAARQKFAADGGFGIGTSEDALRVYFARNLQEPGSGFVVSLRLQRPF